MNATSEQRRAKSGISGGAPDAGARVDVRRRLAFSLAEMMIALAILGLGLLFIAAALPAGVSVARESADLAVADAAAEEALDLIELQLRTSKQIVNPSVNYGGTEPRRADDLFRPRMTPGFGSGGVWRLRDDFEPFIKVRPLELSSIEFRNNSQNRPVPFIDFGETVIERYHEVNGLFVGGQRLLEYDSSFPGSFPNWYYRLLQNPVLSPLSRVYPPITPIRPMLADDYLFDQSNFPRYQSRSGSDRGVFSAEYEKAQSRRIGWTAFYRRASYDVVVGNGPDNIAGTADDIRSPGDPLVYEIIVVVTRRPTDNHRFPTQNPTPANFTEFPTATNLDRLLPMPWLVTFRSNVPEEQAIMQNLKRAPRYDVAGADNFDDSVGSARVLSVDFIDRANFVFTASDELGRLLPPGSILIPAANDNYPTLRNLPPWDPNPPPPNPPVTTNPPASAKRLTGFVPHMPNTLPIYEVIERPDINTVVCKNNGAYPWVAERLNASAFPCWIIPPSFVERSGGQPVYDRRSPILAVHRRLIRIPELP